MQLKIEEQIPIQTKVYRNNMIIIPAGVRKLLNWGEGDKLELYATKKGIFFRKEE